MLRVLALVVALVPLLIACGPSRPKPAAAPASSSPPRAQPFYSTVPCSEQCGSDMGCMSNCSSINNQSPLPPGMRP
ncbi:MAG: hypothetical protein HOO96_42250 [Polyangiaceae bacterium]|nr:hypothetical protein [Polyangiaceae bacterium]